jgi:hypothetical protein
MTDQPILRSRGVVPVTPRESLDAELLRAKALAVAGDLLPRQYRDRPGALLLIDQWAKARDIDTLTAIQTVSFIDGKPIVDATMQRALAKRAGYRVRVIEATDRQATVVVTEGGEELGRETFTMADATRMGLAQKDNWKKNPRNMLVARATTNAIRWHAPEVLAGIGSTADDDDIDDFDLEPIPATTATAATPTVEPEPEVITDAEIVDDRDTLL